MKFHCETQSQQLDGRVRGYRLAVRRVDGCLTGSEFTKRTIYVRPCATLRQETYRRTREARVVMSELNVILSPSSTLAFQLRCHDKARLIVRFLNLSGEDTSELCS